MAVAPQLNSPEIEAGIQAEIIKLNKRAKEIDQQLAAETDPEKKKQLRRELIDGVTARLRMRPTNEKITRTAGARNAREAWVALWPFGSFEERERYLRPPKRPLRG